MKPKCNDCPYLADYTRLFQDSLKANDKVQVQIIQVIKVTTFQDGNPIYHYFDQIGNPLKMTINDM